VRVLMLLFE